MLSKFVGETEKNVRDLFADAEQDQRTLGKDTLFSLICAFVFFFAYAYANWALLFSFSGDASELHVIIFDEIDAICKVHDFIFFLVWISRRFANLKL